MKKAIISGYAVLTFSLLAACGSSSDKKTEAVAVPEAVMTSFNAKYPGTTDVNWESQYKNGKTIFIGEFKLNGKKTEADFDETGSFIEEK